MAVGPPGSWGCGQGKRYEQTKTSGGERDGWKMCLKEGLRHRVSGAGLSLSRVRAPVSCLRPGPAPAAASPVTLAHHPLQGGAGKTESLPSKCVPAKVLGTGRTREPDGPTTLSSGRLCSTSAGKTQAINRTREGTTGKGERRAGLGASEVSGGGLQSLEGRSGSLRRKKT